MPKRFIIRRFLLAVITLAALLFLATLVLVFAGLHDDPAHADLALVLGSKVERDGTPSLRLRARLDKTIQLYQAGLFSKIITSGGTGVEGFDESAVMRDYLVAHGIPRENVLLDSAGTTTFASALNTAQIARQQNAHSVLVISQYFHLPRARLALQRFGLAEVHTAHADYFEWRDLYSCPRELFGYVSYLFRSYELPATTGS